MSSSVCSVECDGDDEEMRASNKLSTSCEQNIDHSKNDKDVSSSNAISDSISEGTNMMHKMTMYEDTLFISDDKLFQDSPPKEDCPICMLPMPMSTIHDVYRTAYQACCGKYICNGCVVVSNENMKKGIIKSCCELCREPPPSSMKVEMRRFKNRTKASDAEAFFMFGCGYQIGQWGKQDMDKALELWNQAAELGSAKAHFKMAIEYYQGSYVKRDMKKHKHHLQLAAIGGHDIARHQLGTMEKYEGYMDISMKHFMIAAKAGFEDSLKEVGEGYKAGHVTKEDFASTLRAYQQSMDDMTSEERVRAASIDVVMAGHVQKWRLE